MRNCATIADEFAQVINYTYFHVDAFRPLITFQMLGEAPEKPTAAPKRKAKALEPDAEGAKKRRVKKPRDPNEPKRPASSYIMFQNEVRKELKSQNPNVSQSDLLHMIAKQWAEMTDEQKAVSTIIAQLHANAYRMTIDQVYSQANASAKERYSAEKAAYIATKNTGADVPATPAPVCGLAFRA
jgi:hypothetical protein